MRTAGAVAVAAVLLPCPAFSNGYPLVFPNTGTYLSRAIRNDLGWDRPVSYSPLLPPLHMKLTASAAVAVQALLTAHTLHLVSRALRPKLPEWWVVPLAGAPAMRMLALVADRLSRGEQFWMAGLAAVTIAVHLSPLQLAAALLGTLLPQRRQFGAGVSLRSRVARAVRAVMPEISFVGSR